MALSLFVYILLSLALSFTISFLFECQYKNCIDCNWTFNCKWINETCKQANYSLAEEWISDIKTCLSKDIEEKSQPYCSNQRNTNPPTKFSLNAKEMNGIGEIFCLWQNSALNSQRSIGFSLADYDENANDKNILLIHYQDNQTQLYMTELVPSYKLLLENVNSFFFVFYSRGNTIHNQTFVFSVFYSTNYLTIFFIILGIVSFCVLFLGIGAFFLLKHLKQKNIPAALTQDSNIIERIPSRDLIKRIKTLSNKKQIEKALISVDFGLLQGREGKEKEKEICTICYEAFSNESKVVELTCKHVFHYDCIRKWCFKEVLNPRCPNCNKDIIPMKDIGLSQNSALTATNPANQNMNIRSNDIMRLRVNNNVLPTH